MTKFKFKVEMTETYVDYIEVEGDTEEQARAALEIELEELPLDERKDTYNGRDQKISLHVRPERLHPPMMRMEDAIKYKPSLQVMTGTWPAMVTLDKPTGEVGQEKYWLLSDIQKGMTAEQLREMECQVNQTMFDADTVELLPELIGELIQYAGELQKLFEMGKSLKDISTWSFEERSTGRNVPYMAITQTEGNNNVIGIWASPTSKQRELKKLFDQKASGSVLPKYKLTVYRDDNGVVFTERLSKTETRFLFRGKTVTIAGKEAAI